MMKQQWVGVVMAMFSGCVFAGADCNKYPKQEWLSVADMQKKIINEYGLTISKFKVDGNCYEIYGWREKEDGRQVKIEIYFDTKTGAIVKGHEEK